MRSKVLHIGQCDKFIPPFIQFIKEQFSFEQHDFMLTSSIADEELINDKNIFLSKKNLFSRFKYYFQVISKMHQADKVILHGLFDIKLLQILLFTPWLLNKCYWVIWGGDLYTYESGKQDRKWKRNEFFRRIIIKRLGHLVTYLEGDLDRARKWYGAKGTYHECFMYTSNLYKKYDLPENKDKKINIQIRNSASESNNHIEVLEKLLPYKDRNICIYVPLSYSSKEHAEKVIKVGKEWFGDKFKPLTTLMHFDDYLSFLSSIDIAFFNHRRQQGMGNTITLLGLGKTVYIRKETSQWEFFKGKGIKVGNIESFNSLDLSNPNENVDIIKEYFSYNNYVSQIEKLLR